ncbi:unnamed protein product [Pylaiella littoralis]
MMTPFSPWLVLERKPHFPGTKHELLFFCPSGHITIILRSIAFVDMDAQFAFLVRTQTRSNASPPKRGIARGRSHQSTKGIIRQGNSGKNKTDPEVSHNATKREQNKVQSKDNEIKK